MTNVPIVTAQSKQFSAPGKILGLPEESYFAIDALSSSGIKTILGKSLYHYQWDLEHPKEQTDAMSLGTLFHALMLEPEKASRYHALGDGCGLGSNADKERRVARLCEILGRGVPPHITDAGKPLAVGKMLSEQIEYLEKEAAAAGMRIVAGSALDGALAMKDEVQRNPVISAILSDGGDSEVTVLWKDREFGCLKKARIDYLPAGHRIILDFKSTEDISDDGCVRAIKRFRYAIQAAHYVQGARAIRLPHNIFCFVFVESVPPYQVRSFYLPQDVFEEAENKIRVASRKYAEAISRGLWPSFGCEIERLDLPTLAV